MLIYCLNGPNLNLLGRREPQIYGDRTLADIKASASARAEALGAALEFRQTNSEGEFVDWVQEAGAKADALIVNAAAYTHTSVALHDALKSLDIPVVEVHLSNPAARESFRHHSYVTPVARGVIAGFGALGYELAVEAAADAARKR